MKRVLICMLVVILLIPTASCSCGFWEGDGGDVKLESIGLVQDAKHEISVVMTIYEQELLRRRVISSTEELEKGWEREQSPLTYDISKIGYRIEFDYPDSDVCVTCRMMYDIYDGDYSFYIAFYKQYELSLEEVRFDFEEMTAIFDIYDIFFETECNALAFVEKNYDSEYLITDFHKNKHVVGTYTSSLGYTVWFEDSNSLNMGVNYNVHKSDNLYTPDGRNDTFYFSTVTLYASGASLTVLPAMLERYNTELKDVMLP